MSRLETGLTEDEQAVLVQAEKPYGSVDERYLRDWLLGTLRSLAESREREGELVSALERAKSLVWESLSYIEHSEQTSLSHLHALLTKADKVFTAALSPDSGVPE
ncbi:hypothetical protein LCGC14_0979660 [marine sediment metagenome]|uniref:Uncharacterized protein n=1 Tax=marine sediment metagenome TaxID=412755 RepID=A0A0F9NVE8_9ZZZZ